jgi:diguanylate cyclase (GGDEF)-like protein
MKTWIAALGVILASASAVWAAAPAPLTTLRAVHGLSNAEASQSLPVAFEATVSYFRDYEHTLFVEDDGVGIYVYAPADARLVPGDRVLIKGITRPSFHPYIADSSVTLLRHGSLPHPMPANYGMLIAADHDCILVTVHGVVRSADLKISSMVLSTRLNVLIDGGIIQVNIESNDASAISKLLDSEVEITGTASGVFDGKMQQTGILIHVQSLAGVKILKPAALFPWSLPVTPMDRILTHEQVNDLTQRVRVSGTITYYQPNSAIVLQSGSRSLWVMTSTISPLRIGDQADAIGFPEVHDGFLTLNEGSVRDNQVQSPIAPQPATVSQLASSKHIFDLVSIEGQVVMEVRENSQDEYVLAADGQAFSAIFRHPVVAGMFPLPPPKLIPLGSRVSVTGICAQQNSNPFDAQVPFNILLRSLDDITVVAKPSLLSIRNLILLVCLLLGVLVSVGARGWTLERKIRRQTAAMAARVEAEALLEHRRSRILEDINGARPLAEILEQITEMVSFRLDGTPCWCEVTDGARLGNCPADGATLRVAREDIPARSGPPLGTLFAGFAPGTEPAIYENEALFVGARLATLAIETRRLYADLRHRSEFDLLTDINNRFTLDKQLDALIQQAREKAGIFGLIYIDLDKFKLVNDTCGHHVGDLYLQEVALRMKRQLRPTDMLARLGGDEFAAVVPMARSRAEVEEIAQRLERCMDAPFTIEGNLLHGSASVGAAVYPEDGTSKDTLLSFADAAMYTAKHTNK